MSAAITGLVTGCDATAANILSGKKALTENGKVTGTMTNQGAVSKSFTPSTSSQSYTVPAGYHNGSGIVTVAAAPTSLIDGTAAAGDVLAGKTFFCDSYTAKTGTMTNRGAWAGTGSFTASAPGTGKSVAVTVPAGYHSGSGKVTVSMGTAKKLDWTSDALAIRSATATGTRIGMMYIGNYGGVAYAGDQYPVYPVGTSGDYTLCWMLIAVGKAYVV
jgi:hypothetical protein